jgi:hypothetical protein
MLRHNFVAVLQRGCALVCMVALRLPFVDRFVVIILDRYGRKHAGKIGPLHPILVQDGVWWYKRELIPEKDCANHTYFNGNGTTLADSLRRSGGQKALLTAAHFGAAILQHSWSGVLIRSHTRNADRELSSGSEGVPRRVVRIHDAVIAMQRNDQNYCHFVTEVLPSIVAWESPALFQSHLVIAKSSFAEPLLRLIGFTGRITQVASPFTAIATDITAIRLLPAGMYHPALLKEVARRARHAAAVRSDACREVVFVSRTARDTRRLTNETDVVAAIQEAFPEVDIFYPGEATVEEQVSRMANARLVIAPHGAAAANMVFASSMEHYVEISFYSPDTKPCFSSLAQVLFGATAHFVASRAVGHGDHHSDHECDLVGLRSALRSIR